MRPNWADSLGFSQVPSPSEHLASFTTCITTLPSNSLLRHEVAYMFSSRSWTTDIKCVSVHMIRNERRLGLTGLNQWSLALIKGSKLLLLIMIMGSVMCRSGSLLEDVWISGSHGCMAEIGLDGKKEDTELNWLDDGLSVTRSKRTNTQKVPWIKANYRIAPDSDNGRSWMQCPNARLKVYSVLSSGTCWWCGSTKAQ